MNIDPIKDLNEWKKHVDHYATFEFTKTISTIGPIGIDENTQKFIDGTYTLTIEVCKSKRLVPQSNNHLLYITILCNPPYNGHSYHPFSRLKDLYQGQIFHGEIVADNEITRSLVKYLCMSDEEIEDKTGFCDTICYRRRIIRSIHDFWDPLGSIE